MGKPNRLSVRIYTGFSDFSVEQAVLAVSQSADSFLTRRIRWAAVWNLNRSRFQKALHAIIAWLTVDVRVIIGCGIEWPKRYADTLGAGSQIIIEQFLPGGSMHACREGDHAVQIKNHRVWAVAHTNLLNGVT